MPAPNVINREQGNYYRAAIADRVLLATDNVAAEVLLAARVGWTIFVELIVVSVTTTAAQSIDFQDSAGTPVEVAGLPASAAEACYRYDFGRGVPLTASTALTFTTSAAGVAAYIHVEGYYVQTSALTIAQHQST